MAGFYYTLAIAHHGKTEGNVGGLKIIKPYTARIRFCRGYLQPSVIMDLLPHSWCTHQGKKRITKPKEKCQGFWHTF